MAVTTRTSGKSSPSWPAGSPSGFQQCLESKHSKHGGDSHRGQKQEEDVTHTLTMNLFEPADVTCFYVSFT